MTEEAAAMLGAHCGIVFCQLRRPRHLQVVTSTLDKLPLTAPTSQDSGELWRLENGRFAPSLRPMTEGFTLSIAMATGKCPLLLRVNSARKEHLGNIAKQQFDLWQPRICLQGDGEARQASLNGVDFARLWRTLEAGEGTFLHHL